MAKRNRSAISGKFVTKKYALRNPKTTVRETVKSDVNNAPPKEKGSNYAKCSWNPSPLISAPCQATSARRITFRTACSPVGSLWAITL